VKVRWTRGATRSLRLVHARIVCDNPLAARRVVEQIQASVARLSSFPASGRGGHVPGTRELVVPGLPYVVVYRTSADAVEVLRVFHTSRTLTDPFD
jgi:toxin ParE1/3/4